MNNKVKIESKVTRLIRLIDMMEEGTIKIPSFQRDFIWTKKQIVELFESIQMSYPIGAILLWRPKEKFKIKHELGPFRVENINKNGFFYILDGFQRLSTLFGCLTNPSKTKFPVNEEKIKDFSIYYDLEKEEFVIPRFKPQDVTYLPLHIIIDTYEYFDFGDRLRNHFSDKRKANELIERGRKLSSTLIDYQIPYVEIEGGDIEQAVKIFSRINSKGTPISKDWIVSARTSNEGEDFNFGQLIKNVLDELRLYNFNDLKREIILQCIQTSFGKIYFDIPIEELIEKKDFIEKAEKTIKSVKKAVKFLFEELLVIERKLLPYNNQLIFLTYFFNEIPNPNKQHINQLKNWFWITTYSNYFTIYSLSKTRTAFEQFQAFIKGQTNEIVYNDKPDKKFEIANFPKKIHFGSVRSIALVLFLINHANDFQKVEANEVDSLDLNYLYSGRKIPENLIPIIQFFKLENNKFIMPGKFENLSFLLKKEDYKKIFKKLFIYEEMLELPKNKVLQLRKGMIKNEEKKFIETFGLESPQS